MKKYLAIALVVIIAGGAGVFIHTNNSDNALIVEDDWSEEYLEEDAWWEEDLDEEYEWEEDLHEDIELTALGGLFEEDGTVVIDILYGEDGLPLEEEPLSEDNVLLIDLIYNEEGAKLNSLLFSEGSLVIERLYDINDNLILDIGSYIEEKRQEALGNSSPASNKEVDDYDMVDPEKISTTTSSAMIAQGENIDDIPDTALSMGSNSQESYYSFVYDDKTGGYKAVLSPSFKTLLNKANHINYNEWRPDTSLPCPVTIGKSMGYQVTSLEDFFSYMSHLMSVDVSGWDVSGVKSTASMFEGCSMLKTINGLDKWNTNSLSDTSNMFDTTAVVTLK